MDLTTGRTMLSEERMWTWLPVSISSKPGSSTILLACRYLMALLSMSRRTLL
jgi:hypothetical protein